MTFHSLGTIETVMGQRNFTTDEAETGIPQNECVSSPK
jgi:hypothetical protein